MDSNRRKCFGEQLPPVEGNSIVPSLVRECVINIEKQCNLEGLFEADESQPYSDEVKEFIKQLDRVKKGSISTILPNAHISSGVLKHYLSNLSKPVTPAELLLQEKGIESDKEVEQYLAFHRAIKNLPKENQLLLGYLLSFYFRLERKQATHTAEKFGKVFGPAFVGIRATEKQKEFSRKLYTNIIKSIDLHFPIGTTVAAPTAPTISLKEDSEVPVGYIAVRVNNYQVTSLIKGVQVKSVRALYKFEARKDSEISMDPGDIIEVTYQDDQPGWWEGRLRGKTGIFPANYCEVYEILKKKMRILKIDTKKVSDKILLMQHALNFGKGEQPKEEKDEREVEEEKKEEKKEEIKEEIKEEKKEEKKESSGGSQIQENFTNFQEISSLENLKLFSVLNENKNSISIPFEKIEETFQFYHKILFDAQNKLNQDISLGESNETLVFYIEDEEPANKKQTTQNNNQKQPQKVEETKKIEIKEEKKIEIQEKPKENEKQVAKDENKKAGEIKEKENKKQEEEKGKEEKGSQNALLEVEKKEKERKTKEKNNKKVKEDKKEKKTKEKSKTGSRKSSTLPKPEKKSKSSSSSSKSKPEKKKKGENKPEKVEKAEKAEEEIEKQAALAEQKLEASTLSAPPAENNKANKELKKESVENKEQANQQDVDKKPSEEAAKPTASAVKPAEKSPAQPVALPAKVAEPVKEKETPAPTPAPAPAPTPAPAPAAIPDKVAEAIKEKEVAAPAAQAPATQVPARVEDVKVEEKKVAETKVEVKLQEEKKVEASKAEAKGKEGEVKKKLVVKIPPKAAAEKTEGTITPGDKKPTPKATAIPKNVSSPSVKPSSPSPLVINQANLSAFEKDRELFEKLQAIQQQIEQERIRRSQIEVDLQSVTGQLVSVISKFENRRHAKDRLVNSIQKQRTKTVKT